MRDLAAPLPMIVIGDMLGVAPEDRDDLLRWSDDMVSAQGGNVTDEQLMSAATAFTEYQEYAGAVIERRRQEPTDDLMSMLVHAEVDGDRLEDDDLVHESLLILVGGDETTRHVISGGMEQLLLHPDQHRRLVDDRDGLDVAIEEMLRWVSPIKNMCRTVTRDAEFFGSQLHEGQKVMLLYESANFDEQQFDDPERFDSARQPNDHVAFGFGAHFCLGNSLARLEMRVMFDRLLERLPDLHLARRRRAAPARGHVHQRPRVDAGGVHPDRATLSVSTLREVGIEFLDIAPLRWDFEAEVAAPARGGVRGDRGAGRLALVPRAHGRALRRARAVRRGDAPAHPHGRRGVPRDDRGVDGTEPVGVPGRRVQRADGTGVGGGVDVRRVGRRHDRALALRPRPQPRVQRHQGARPHRHARPLPPGHAQPGAPAVFLMHASSYSPGE